jgi:hypothetical protein
MRRIRRGQFWLQIFCLLHGCSFCCRCYIRICYQVFIFIFKTPFIELSDALEENLVIPLIEMQNCYLDRRCNSSDLLALCPVFVMKYRHGYAGAMSNSSTGVIGLRDKCFDESRLENRTADLLAEDSGLLY